MPEIIADPAIVIRRGNTLSYIDNQFVKTKKEVAAPLLIGINTDSIVDNQPADEIKSIYGKDEFKSWLIMRAKDSVIFSGNSNKAVTLLRDVGFNISEPVAYATDLTYRILSQVGTDSQEQNSAKLSADAMDEVRDTVDDIAPVQEQFSVAMPMAQTNGLKLPEVEKTEKPVAARKQSAADTEGLSLPKVEKSPPGNKKTATEGGTVKYNASDGLFFGDYFPSKKGTQKFDWTKKEKELAYYVADREIGNDEKYIDSNTKYLYASEKGVKVFALYGIGNGSEATILYATGSKNAEQFNKQIIKFLEGLENGTYKSRTEFDRWVASIRGQQTESSNNISNPTNRRSKRADDKLSGRESERIGKGNFDESEGNQRRTSSVGLKKFSAADTEGEYLSLAEKYRDGTATEAETEQLRQAVEAAAKKAGYEIAAYHGTSSGGFTVFDSNNQRFGLFGLGFYLTENKDIAESYTKKGKGTSPTVYSVFAKISNPIDMDAPADIQKWEAAFNELDYDATELLKSKTNEEAYRALLNEIEDAMLPSWEGEEIARDVLSYQMGYDGITHIGGGRYARSDGTKHRVWIAFESEQVKSADLVTYDDNGEIIPLSERFDSQNTDIRYSAADTEAEKKAAKRYIAVNSTERNI